jgi:hypothetical protein
VLSKNPGECGNSEGILLGLKKKGLLCLLESNRHQGNCYQVSGLLLSLPEEENEASKSDKNNKIKEVQNENFKLSEEDSRAYESQQKGPIDPTDGTMGPNSRDYQSHNSIYIDIDNKESAHALPSPTNLLRIWNENRGTLPEGKHSFRREGARRW